jgi:ferredoxin-NADP reductase
LSRSIQKLVALGLSCVLGVGALASPMPHQGQTVDALKARISSANVGDKPHLCVQVAEMRLTEADKLYEAGELDKAQSALTDVVAYSELARDYSIQSHKYQKQSEIAVRGMTRKLTNILHTLGSADQAAVKDAMNRLDRVRDDLLASMFKKGGK